MIKTSQILDRLSYTAIERFWAKVNKLGSLKNIYIGHCWEWTASVEGGGYGQFSLLGKGKALIKAHRLSFLIENGHLPESKEVCHACDNPKCVRPSHLFLGSHKENMLDAKGKGRMKIASKGRAGELNNQAKLKASDIPVILRLRSEGISQVAVARQFGVSCSCVSLIERRKKWNTTNGLV